MECGSSSSSSSLLVVVVLWTEAGKREEPPLLFDQTPFYCLEYMSIVVILDNLFTLTIDEKYMLLKNKCWEQHCSIIEYVLKVKTASHYKAYFNFSISKLSSKSNSNLNSNLYKNRPKVRISLEVSKIYSHWTYILSTSIITSNY